MLVHNMLGDQIIRNGKYQALSQKLQLTIMQWWFFPNVNIWERKSGMQKEAYEHSRDASIAPHRRTLI